MTSAAALAAVRCPLLRPLAGRAALGMTAPRFFAVIPC